MQKTIKEISKILRFEFWLRFYFVQETDDGTLQLVLDKDELQKLQKYRPWDELAEGLYGKALDPQVCQINISTFLNRHFDEQNAKNSVVAHALDNKELQKEQHLFTVWAKLHEKALEEKIWDFDHWENSFTLWQKSDAGEQIA